MASTGGDVSGSMSEGAAVTSCTDSMRVSRANSRSVVSKLSARTDKLPSGCISCRMGLSPRRDATAGCSNTGVPAGGRGRTQRDRMAPDLPSTLTASLPRWASASGPLGVYCRR